MKHKLTLRDDNGEPVGPGDTIRFSYGIPPVVVMAKVVERDGKLIALTPGHNPTDANLRSLRKHVGEWYKGEGYNKDNPFVSFMDRLTPAQQAAFKRGMADIRRRLGKRMGAGKIKGVKG